MTKSYYYIPTHFLYSSLLFFLLIFMYQLIHCHTLLQPFFKIFLFRIYVPTNTHTTQTIDPALDETSVRHPQIYAPIQPPQTNPPTTTDTQIPRQSSHHKPIHNDTVPQIPRQHCHTKPIHQRPQIPHPYSPTDTNTTQPRPTDAVDAPTLTRRQATPYPDAVAASARFVPPYLDRPRTQFNRPHTSRPARPQSIVRAGPREPQMSHDNAREPGRLDRFNRTDVCGASWTEGLRGFFGVGRGSS